MDAPSNFSASGTLFGNTVQGLKNICDTLVDVNHRSQLGNDSCFKHNVYFYVNSHTDITLMQDIATVAIVAQQAIANLVTSTQQNGPMSISAVIKALRQISQNTAMAATAFEKNNTLETNLKNDFKGIFYGNLSARVNETIQKLEASIRQGAPNRPTPQRCVVEVSLENPQTLPKETPPAAPGSLTVSKKPTKCVLENSLEHPQTLPRGIPPPPPGPLKASKKPTSRRQQDMNAAVANEAFPCAKRQTRAPVFSEEVLQSKHHELTSPQAEKAEPIKLTELLTSFSGLDVNVMNSSRFLYFVDEGSYEEWEDLDEAIAVAQSYEPNAIVVEQCPAQSAPEKSHEPFKIDIAEQKQLGGLLSQSLQGIRVHLVKTDEDSDSWEEDNKEPVVKNEES